MISDAKLIYIWWFLLQLKYICQNTQNVYIILFYFYMLPTFKKKQNAKQKQEHLDHVLLIDTQLRHSRMIKHMTLINHLFNEYVTATGRIIWEAGLSGSKWLHCCGLCLLCIGAFISFCLLIKFLSWACFGHMNFNLNASVCHIQENVNLPLTCQMIHHIKALTHTNTHRFP